MTLLSPANVARFANAKGPSLHLPAATGVAFNSAHVQPGQIFFAMPGAARHGIAFADQALERGAAYVVSDEPHPRGLLVTDPAAVLFELGRRARQLLKGPVIGITGTAGKTTTKTLLAAALQARSTPGNFNTPLALAQALVHARLHEEGQQAHAPEAANRLSAAEAATPLVLELGIDHEGEMGQLIDLTSPEHAVVTTIGASHLTGLGTVEVVAREKGQLLLAAPGVRLAGAGAAAHLPPQALERATVVSAEVTLHGSVGSTLHAFGRSIPLPWPGRPAAEGALLALTMAAELGTDIDVAVQRMLGARLEGARLQRRPIGSITLLDDSYNSNPVSVKAALEVLFRSSSPRVAFLGDMLELGELEASEHRKMGAATVGLDLVVGIGDASAHMLATNPAALWAKDAKSAADYIDRIPANATVLVKGSRGVHLERLIAMLEQQLTHAKGAPSP